MTSKLFVIPSQLSLTFSNLIGSLPRVHEQKAGFPPLFCTFRLDPELIRGSSPAA